MDSNAILRACEAKVIDDLAVHTPARAGSLRSLGVTNWYLAGEVETDAVLPYVTLWTMPFIGNLLAARAGGHTEKLRTGIQADGYARDIDLAGSIADRLAYLLLGVSAAVMDSSRVVPPGLTTSMGTWRTSPPDSPAYQGRIARRVTITLIQDEFYETK